MSQSQPNDFSLLQEDLKMVKKTTVLISVAHMLLLLQPLNTQKGRQLHPGCTPDKSQDTNEAELSKLHSDCPTLRPSLEYIVNRNLYVDDKSMSLTAVADQYVLNKKTILRLTQDPDKFVNPCP